jgi:hypothetical protein
VSAVAHEGARSGCGRSSRKRHEVHLRGRTLTDRALWRPRRQGRASSAAAMLGLIGGPVEGSGRKKKISDAQLLADEIRERADELVAKTFQLATEGQLGALRILFEYGFGRPRQSVELSGPGWWADHDHGARPPRRRGVADQRSSRCRCSTPTSPRSTPEQQMTRCWKARASIRLYAWSKQQDDPPLGPPIPTDGRQELPRRREDRNGWRRRARLPLRAPGSRV